MGRRLLKVTETPGSHFTLSNRDSGQKRVRPRGLKQTETPIETPGETPFETPCTKYLTTLPTRERTKTSSGRETCCSIGNPLLRVPSLRVNHDHLLSAVARLSLSCPRSSHGLRAVALIQEQAYRAYLHPFMHTRAHRGAGPLMAPRRISDARGSLGLSPPPALPTGAEPWGAPHLQPGLQVPAGTHSAYKVRVANENYALCTQERVLLSCSFLRHRAKR